MKLVDNIEIYEKLHFRELQTREQVTSRLQISLGLLVALAGALSFLLGAVDREGSGAVFFAFWVLLFGASAALTWAAVRLARVFWGNTYSEFPTAKVVRDYEAGEYSYFFDPPPPPELAPPNERTAKELFDEKFKAFLVDKFVNCATKNAKVNDARAEHLHHANRALLVAACIAFIAFIWFTFGNLRTNAPARIELAKPTDVNVLSLPVTCLTCAKDEEETCEKQGECLPHERKEPDARAAGKDTAAPSAGEIGQGAHGAPPAPTALPFKEEVTQ
jgi:hypothetical protein